VRLISMIESKRNKLCYGTPRSADEIRVVIDAFNRLRHKFRKAEAEIG